MYNQQNEDKMMLHIVFIDVGHGDCAVIFNETKTSVVVIDCGNGPSLINFLHAEQIDHI